MREKICQGGLISVAAGCASDRGCRSAVEDEVNSWFGNETNKVEQNGGSSDNTLYLGGSSNYDNGNYGVYTRFNDYGNISWFDTPQPEDDYDGYDGYDAGSDGGFYGEPNSEGFPGDSNSFGPTIPSAYIDPVQEMIYQDYQRYQNNREFDGIQRTLDAAGLVPVFGIAADLVNAGISAARGRWKDAAMSLGAAVPIVGMAAGLYRLGKGGLKGAKGARGAQSIINRVMKANPRTTRGGGKGVQIQLRSGRVLDITKSRVKEFVPTARNPGSGMGRVRFRPGSGGFKRPPTRRDLELLNHFSR